MKVFSYLRNTIDVYGFEGVLHMSFKTLKYKDHARYTKIHRAQNRRYYGKTAFLYTPREWTPEEDEQVLNSNLTDMELSLKIERSVSAIQVRRSRLKRLMGSTNIK